MAALEKALTSCAEMAVWYRLQIIIGDAAWCYAALDRPTMRFDGQKRQGGGFRLTPYEPPVVPKRGTYAITFHDWEGNLVENRSGCYELEVEPVVVISVESGTKLHDFR